MKLFMTILSLTLVISTTAQADTYCIVSDPNEELVVGAKSFLLSNEEGIATLSISSQRTSQPNSVDMRLIAAFEAQIDNYVLAGPISFTTETSFQFRNPKLPKTLRFQLHSETFKFTKNHFNAVIIEDLNDGRPMSKQTALLCFEI